MDLLYREINGWIGKPFIWGERDCMIVLGDWVQKVHGFDPVADLRFTYDSAGSCQRQTRFFTDPVAAVARFAEDICGFQRVEEPSKGDVGVLRVPVDGKMQPVGGLFTGHSWAVKAPMGASTIQPHEVLAIWGVGYEGKD